MGVYNCADTLAEAIDSILAQTYPHWELILCDDGSTDETYAVAEGYRDRFPHKIKLLKNGSNLGLAPTLNRCLAAATGDYCARMDGDDLSLSTRFARQVDFLDTHSDIAIVSTPMLYFDRRGDWGRGAAVEFPGPMDFVRGTPFCHGPAMIRADALRAVGGYAAGKGRRRAEDYDLWFRMYAAGYRGCNLPDPLYKMRDDENALRRRTLSFALNEAAVRFHGYGLLGLPWWTRLYALRPIAVALLPAPLYGRLHRAKLHRKGEGRCSSTLSH